jgi:hypothetical protein
MPSRVDAHLRRAREARRSSRYVALRLDFDAAGDDWTELVRDVVALANSGGGAIVTGGGVSLARLAEEVEHASGVEFTALERHEVERDGGTATAIVVGEAGEAPLVFDGAVLFRHGARNAPATPTDLRRFMERRVKAVRAHWLGGIRRLMAAPPGSEIVAIERLEPDAAGERRIRITTDADAPLYGRVDPDETHPYRQKELLQEVNARLPGETDLTSFDVQAIKRMHGIGPESTPEFAHRHKFSGSPQYSEAFVDWIVDHVSRDGRFLGRARAAYSEFLKRQRRRARD